MEAEKDLLSSILSVFGGEVVETRKPEPYVHEERCYWADGSMMVNYWRSYWKESAFHEICHREVERIDGRERWLEKGEIVAVYTDGGCIGHNGPGGSREGGTWAWCGVNAEGVRVVERSGVLLPDRKTREIYFGITNNQAEFMAVCKALSYLPDGWSGKIFTDSTTIFWRFEQVKRRSPKAMTNTPDVWKRGFYRHLERLGSIEVVVVKGHSGEEHNEYVDKLCNEAKCSAPSGKEIVKV